ncbi:MAG: DNA-binding transcriptional repressor YiaJ [Nitrospira sp.]|nr:DNA-binding transcriptional repressor YiaJ [Nitrospira sp.]
MLCMRSKVLLDFRHDRTSTQIPSDSGRILGLLTKPLPEGGRQPEVRSVARALHALEIIAQAPPTGISLLDITETLGASRSSVWVLMQTLVRADAVAEVGPRYGRRYVIGAGIARLVDVSRQGEDYLNAAIPHLDALTQITGFTSRLAVLSDGVLKIVSRQDAPGAIGISLHFGQPELFHCSSVGKAVLSLLPEDRARAFLGPEPFERRTRNTITRHQDLFEDLETVRQRGYSVDYEEDFEGIICVGSGIDILEGRLIGAVSVTALKPQLPNWRLEAVGQEVRAAAQAFTEQYNLNATTFV